MTNPKEKGKGPGSFAAMLASVRPKTDVELSEKMSQLIEDVKVTGKKGTMTVQFEVKPVDGGGRAVIVNDRISVKPPEKNREGSMAYIGEDNRLQRTDPAATPLFDYDDVRSAPAEHIDYTTGEIKDVPNA